MNQPEPVWRPDKKDYLFALLLAIFALAAYVRTLAPDILYGDSAEFQCLAYTFGITHSTGYPTYLFLGRLLGYLPINSPAWRITLLSAICAAIAVGGIYLLARYFTRSRIGAALGAVALGISYSFWSQAVIAEVYTPGVAFLVIILLLMFHWQIDPEKHGWFLFFAALSAGVGFGVHASVWLVSPPAVAFVVWSLWARRALRQEWIHSISAGFFGAVLGLVIFLAVFIVSDQLNSPTSFMRTTLEPSRVFWDLPLEGFSSPIERIKMVVMSAQWGGSLFPGGDFSPIEELVNFLDRLWKIEFPPLVLLFALVGFVIMLIKNPVRGAFLPLAFLVSLFFVLNYRIGDKNVFYLSLYIPLMVAAGTGMGYALDRIHHFLEIMPGRGNWLLYLFPILFLITMVVQPVASTRWQALRTGAADFVTEDYPYPVKNLREPRKVAQTRMAGVAENAVFVLDWRGLFATAYLAHVEKGLTDILFFEAMPYGNDGKVATTLIAVLEGYVKEGRDVYAEQKYPGLEEHFRLIPTSGNMYRLSLKK